MAATALRSDTPNGTDEAARLFEAHSDLLLGYCLRQLGSRSEAEDAVQTTFVYALRALRRGVVPENEAAWLTTIAKNVCRWQRRTLNRRGPLASDVELDTIALAVPDGDEDGVLLGLRDALAAIPERQRHALLLREWQGLPTGEIASRLGLSGPATNALLTRARHSLAQALTVPRRPVLGLGWLIFDLRSHVKALLDGMSAKAVATTVAVVGLGAGVGGLAIERSLADAKSPAGPAPAVDRSPVESGVIAPRIDSTSTSPVVRRAGREKTSTPTTRPAAGVADAASPEPRVVPTAPLPRAGDPQESPERAPEALPPAPEPRVDLRVDPPLPKVEPPTHVLPPIYIPPLELPPVPPVPPLPTDDLPLPDLPLPDLPLP